MLFSKSRASDAATAVIDIGSNSIRMVVYRGHPRAPAIIFNEKVMAGLGRELLSTGAIAADAMHLGEQALARFARLCAAMAVERIACFATAAVRDASNGDEFLAMARRLGFAPEILDGPEEAELAAYGVMSAIPDARGIVGDLGGGSLELALIDQGQILAKHSFALGVLRLAQMRAAGPEQMTATAQAMLAAADWPMAIAGLPLYLVGGSWRSLARLDMQLTSFPVPVVHHYQMAAERAQLLYDYVTTTDRTLLKTVPSLSGARIPTLADAAWLLALTARMLDLGPLITSAYGAREGWLFRKLAAKERLADPLLVAAQDVARAESRFAFDAELLAQWIAPLAGEEPAGWARIRRAACALSDVAWRANPNFRAERGLEIGLHGNWVGITPAERELLGQALFTCFGGGTKVFPGGGALSDANATQAAIGWGLALRLAQRIGAGTAPIWSRSRLGIGGETLTLYLRPEDEMLYGAVAERRHRQLANFHGLTHQMQII